MTPHLLLQSRGLVRERLDVVSHDHPDVEEGLSRTEAILFSTLSSIQISIIYLRICRDVRVLKVITKYIKSGSNYF